MDRRGELRELIAARTAAPGVTPSVLPGLRFNRAERPTAHTSHRVTQLALAVIAQGAKVCRIGDRSYHYDADTFLVFTGESQYSSAIVEASRARPYLSLSLQLPADTVVRTLLSLGEGVAGEPIEDAPAFAAPLAPSIVDAACRLVHTLDDAGERQMVAPLVLAELVYRLLRSPAAATIRAVAGRYGDKARIDQAMVFMRANLTRRLSVAAVARHVAMSPSHFAHRFRQVARTSPMHYLKQARLDAARVALLDGSGSPAEIAARVGYQSAAHFSRDFKASFALPPATYARQFRAIAGSGKTIAGGGIAGEARAT